MRAYRCPRCQALLDLSAWTCDRCGAPVGFALEPGVVLELDATTGSLWVRCAGSGGTPCNWLVPRGGNARCESCRLTRTVPGGDDPDDLTHLWALEGGKRRLVYQLHDLGLPIVDRVADPERGLCFDLLSSRMGPVIIGHANGVITIDLSESDDAHRAMLKAQLDEPYRTVVGHLRHEIGHYYWDVLVDRGGHLEAFRALFGDERASYQEALDRHYREGAPQGWELDRVSAYATMHPWEDWAETFAHYLHIRDTLQTAAAWGIVVGGPVGDPSPQPGVVPMDDVDDREFSAVADDWARFTAGLNAVNRSMGHGDLYPFDLTRPVIAKMAFVHDLVRAPGS